MIHKNKIFSIAVIPSIFLLFFITSSIIVYAQNTTNISLTPEQKKKIELLMDMGIRYEHEDKLDKAAETFRQALEIDPNNILVKVRLAKILSWKGKYDEALKYLNEVLNKVPNHPEALFRKAQILSWQGKYNEAIATYQIYLLEEKNDADALMGIGRVCFWSGWYEKAIEYFNRAIKAGGDKIDAYLNLGKIYLAIDNKEKAKEMFKKVLEIDPNNKDAKKFLAGIRTMKTFEIEPLTLNWYYYTDGNIGITTNTSLLYHYKQKIDFLFKFEDSAINSQHDQKFTTGITYMGIENLYLGVKYRVTYDPDFSEYYFGELSLHYNFKKVITPGIMIDYYRFSYDTMVAVKPELQKDFSDVSYARVRFNQYLFSDNYKASTIELYIQFEYYNKNTIYVNATYGGDSEIKDPNRRIFDFGLGISYDITDNLGIKFGYGWLETQYGRTHELTWQNTVKW